MKTMKTVYAFLLIFLMSAAAAKATTAATTKSVFINDSTITKDATGKNSTKHIYTYNQYGKKTIDEVMYWDPISLTWIYSGVTPKSTRQELTYNSLNENILTLKSIWNSTTHAWDKSTKSVSVFDLNAKEISSEDSTIDAGTGKYRANYHSENTYDIKGNKTSIRNKWNATANTTTGALANTWTAPYDRSIVFSDSIDGTDTLGITKKYFRTLNVTTATYDKTSSTFIDASKTETVYQTVATKTPSYIAQATKIGSVNLIYSAPNWTPNFKLDILGDSTVATTTITKSTYAAGAYVLTSIDYRYFSPRIVEIFSTPNALNNTSAIELTLSPNPVKDILKVSGLVESSKITILDLTGKAVITKIIANNESLSVGTLTPGIYIAKVTNLQGELVYRTKLIKQ